MKFWPNVPNHVTWLCCISQLRWLQHNLEASTPSCPECIQSTKTEYQDVLSKSIKNTSLNTELSQCMHEMKWWSLSLKCAYTTTGFQALVDSNIFVFDGDTFVEKKPKEVTDDLSIDCSLESSKLWKVLSSSLLYLVIQATNDFSNESQTLAKLFGAVHRKLAGRQERVTYYSEKKNYDLKWFMYWSWRPFLKAPCVDVTILDKFFEQIKQKLCTVRVLLREEMLHVKRCSIMMRLLKVEKVNEDLAKKGKS